MYDVDHGMEDLVRTGVFTLWSLFKSQKSHLEISVLFY